MMHIFLPALFKGLVFGLTLAAIPGPIFFLIIQKTLTQGILAGLACTCGALLADFIYACIAAIGLTVLANTLLQYQPMLIFFGGLLLIYLGITTIYTKVEPSHTNYQKVSPLRAFISTTFLTLASPITIFSYGIFFASIGFNAEHVTLTSAGLVIGVILGVAIFDIGLIGILSIIRHKLSTSFLTIVNRVAGGLLILFGTMAFIRSCGWME